MKGLLKSKLIFTLVMILLLVPFFASIFIRYGSVAHASPSNGHATASPAMANANLSWILTNGPMTTAHGFYGAAKLQDGRVLAISGDSNGGLTPVTDVYNPASRTWSQTGAVNQPRYGFYDAVTLNSGKVLIAGGTDAGASTDYASAELYDPSTGKWGYTGSLNTARRNPVVVKLQDGRVLVASGANGPPDGNRFLFTSEIYDPATGQFTYTTGNLPLAREGGDSGVLLHDGQVMMLGGEGPWMTFSPEVELYNPASDTWSETGSLPHGISGGSLVVLQDGRVMLIGGDYNGSALAEVELYDPSTGTWSPAKPLHYARDAPDSILLPNGKVLVAGGSDGNGNAVLVSEIYDPSANSWTDDAPLQHMHVRARMIQLDSGELLMAGGYDSNGPTTASELYTSTTDNKIYGGVSFETSLAIDPTNPSHIVVGFINTSELTCSWAESTDAGASWVIGTLSGPTGLIYATQTPLGDPWVRFGPDGTLFYSCLMAAPALGPDGVFVRIATTGKASDLNGLHNSAVVTSFRVKVDHPSIAALKMSNGSVRLVECWAETRGQSDVVNVAYSDSPYVSWSKPQTISSSRGDNDYCTIGGGNGLIAVSWANVQQNKNIPRYQNTLQLKVSTDGATWSRSLVTVANAGILVHALDGTLQLSTTDKVLSVPYALIVPNGTGLRAFYEVRSGDHSQVYAVDLDTSGKLISQPTPIGGANTETFLPGAGTCSNVVGMYQGTPGATADFRYTIWSLDPQTGTWIERFKAIAASNAQSAPNIYGNQGRRIGDYTGVDCTMSTVQAAWADTREGNSSMQKVDIWGASVGLP